MDFKTWSSAALLTKTTKLFLVVLFALCLAVPIFGEERQRGDDSGDVNVTDNGTATVTPAHSHDKQHPKAPPLQPYPRLLPLQLSTPPTAQAGSPLDGLTVSLFNPGSRAPNARLRILIHDAGPAHAGDHLELSPDNVKVEVLEKGVWKPVRLGLVEDGVMGAIGTEGGSDHHERFKRGGFAIPAGMHRTWQLRVTFGLPGTYTLVAAVSPDNGSRHLARPAHSVIEVQ